MEVLHGKIEKIIYHNSSNGYTVLLLKRKHKLINTKNTIMAKGTFFNIKIDDELCLIGNVIKDDKYGYEFQVQSYDYDYPVKPDMLEKYIVACKIKGVGKDKASKIIQKFGKETINVLRNDYMRLTEIKGIGEKTALKIGQEINKQKEMQDVLISLTNYGITGNLANKIYAKYKQDSISTIRQNPYQLISDIKGIGFTTADKIALENGIDKNSQFRIKAGIVYMLELNKKKGHMYSHYNDLIKTTCKILDVYNIEEYLNEMIEEETLTVVNEDKVYITRDYYTERKLANNIIRVAKAKIKSKINNSLLKEVSKNLNAEQTESVRVAIRSGLSIITGGPGTGKSTTLKAIINYFKNSKLNIALAAPTGRAAKRMTEVTEMDAKTIHRLLEVIVINKQMSFKKDESNPLAYDVLLIDEVSMLDTYLANSLFKAIRTGTRVVLIGDNNQLPSVDAGNVLEDIINARICPTTRLKHVYRQSANSHIITNANAILNGDKLNISNDSTDFFFKPSIDPDEIKSMLIHYTVESLPAFTGEKDIQVLSPIKDGPLGVNELNKVLQEKINPNKEELYGFRENDKVMQIENDYERLKYNGTKSATGVFNGDTGKVINIDKENNTITVEFYDGWNSTYKGMETESLTLAFAMSIHKSQGGEYPVVVIPIYNYIPQLTSKNLIYTAITRAKKTILLIGSYKKLISMINNVEITKRNTSLEEFLKNNM